MAGAATTATTHWAVIIGINFYVAEKERLSGCVRDVEAVKRDLEGGSVPVDIAILTATTPADERSRLPAEDQYLWPTYEHVVEKLMKVLKGAKQGDFVYIHYSGHGTRTKNPKKPYQAGDLALVLFHSEHGSHYFRGEQLANCLRQMVDKGLLVTVVLDCCFSGSAVRTGNIRGGRVRSVDYDPAIDAASTSQEESCGTDWFDPGRDIVRNAQMFDNWLVNPTGYTILSACGPHEIAQELTLTESGERRGALSYFLGETLRTLRKRGVEVMHQSLYQHIRARFHASWPQQTPMRYGNENHTFFGKLGVSSGASTLVPIYRIETETDKRLLLSSGEAHGVCVGDEYNAYPFGMPEDDASQPNEASVRVRVTTVRHLTSDLAGVKSAQAAEQVDTGWKATLVTSLSPLKVSIRLMKSACSQIRRREAAEQQRYLRLCAEDEEDTEACPFNVVLNADRKYEILDGSLEKINNLPTIPLDIPEADSHLMGVLQHLATFKYFEAIENRTPSRVFEASFSLLPTNHTGNSGVFDVKHGEEWSLTVKNNSSEPLYLGLFNFAPSWEVANLVSRAGGGDYIVVEGEDSEIISLTMTVPEFLLRDRCTPQCEDVVKVFVTSKPASFPSMILPHIPLYSGNWDGAVRGNSDTLSAFLTALTTTFRFQGGKVDENWATRNFIIRTTME